METLTITGVSETIVHYLRIHIIDGQLPPGHKLNELELSSRLGVSRPPLREAFRVLENEHLIKGVPRKGCYVSDMSLDECREIFQAREMIECFAIDVLKEKRIRDLPDVDSALAATAGVAMPTTSDAYEKFDYLKAIANFHISLVKSASNSRLSRFYDAITYNLARYQGMYVFIPGLMEKSRAAHEEILNLIRKGNYGEAREGIRSHIRGYYEITEEKLKSSQVYKVGP